MVTQIYLRRIIWKIKEWMIDHNLGRDGDWDEFIPDVGAFPGLVMILRYGGRHGYLRNLFDTEYGGGSIHLLNDFDDEVLKPLKLRMERLGPYEIGLFQGRKLPRTKRSR